MHVNVFVMVPWSAMQGEHLNGYRIGAYRVTPAQLHPRASSRCGALTTISWSRPTSRWVTRHVADAHVLFDLVERVERSERAGLPRIPPGGLKAYRKNHVRGPFVHVDVRGRSARW